MTDIAPSAESQVPETTAPSGELGRIVDWAVAGLLVLSGLTLAAGGAALLGAANRSWIAWLVESGRIESVELTTTQLIDVTYGLAWWGGIALLLTGLAYVLGGIAFLVYRRRTRRYRAEHGIQGPDRTTNAVLGGAVSVLTSFVPFSPVLGGVAAGYLQGGERSEGVRVGAYAGLVIAVPLAILTVFVLGGLAVLAAQLGLGWPAFLGGIGLVIGVLVGMIYLVGLSAIGGYLGVVLGERKRAPKA